MAREAGLAPGHPGSDRTWKLSGTPLRVREFPDGSLVYNTLSGDTHLLARVQWAVVDALRAGPCRASGILEQIKPRLGLAGVEAFEVGDGPFEQCLATLSALELIEPAEE